MNQRTDSCCLSSRPGGVVFEAYSARPVPKVLRWMFGAGLRRLSRGKYIIQFLEMGLMTFAFNNMSQTQATWHRLLSLCILKAIFTEVG